MTAPRYYTVTVALLLEAEDGGAALDAVNEILREQCEDFAPGSALVTWSIVRDIRPTTFDRSLYPVGASYDAPVPGGEG